MWLLPTRGRPEICQATLDACEAMKMTSFGLVIADATKRDQYRDLRLPDNWLLTRKRMDLQPVKNWVLKHYPDEPFYGLICDDMIPKTLGWDRQFEDEAGAWNMIGCEDEYRSTSVGVHGMPTDFAGAMGWGGELLRCVGWWGPPWAKRATGDDSWLLIAQAAGVRRHLKQVVVEHRNWKTKKREKDGTDEWVRDGVDQVAADFHQFGMWRAEGKFEKVAQKIREAMSD